MISTICNHGISSTGNIATTVEATIDLSSLQSVMPRRVLSCPGALRRLEGVAS